VRADGLGDDATGLGDTDKLSRLDLDRD